jgi:hypothetical protein
MVHSADDVTEGHVKADRQEWGRGRAASQVREWEELVPLEPEPVISLTATPSWDPPPSREKSGQGHESPWPENA